MTASSAGVQAHDLSPWAPLRNRVFFALFVAQLVSNLGTLMQSVGAAWLMGDLGATSAQIAMVQTATFLPVLLVGIPAGALADLFDRRKLLLGTQLMMLVSAASMAIFTFADAMTPTAVLSLTFVLGTGAALMSPAWMAIQPDLVGKEQFAQAVSLGSMTYNVGRAIGPAIGGVIIAAAGAGWVFAINAVSFVGTMLVLYLWHPPKHAGNGTPAETFVGATIAGMRYSANSRLVRTVLVRVALLMLPGCALQALLPIVVRGPLEWTAGGYGILLGCFGLGATISAILRPHIVIYLHPDAVMVVAAVVLGGTLLVQGFVHERILVGVSLAAGGFMWSLATTATTVAAQAAMPAWVRARGMAVYSLVLTGSIAIGSAMWGVAANWGLGLSHLIAAGLMLVSGLASLRWPLTWDREFDMTMLPGDEPDVIMTPLPTDGPVLVTIAYRVPLDRLAEFSELMDYVEGHRRRTGGYQWALFRDLSDPERFVETFLVSSWAEHLRQHHRQTARSDAQMARVRPFVDSPGVGHYLSATSEGAMELHLVQPKDDVAHDDGEDL